MRPYSRQQHGHSGRSHRPPGQGFRPPMEHQGFQDPDYIAYLQQKAEHYTDKLAALSINRPMPTPSAGYAGMYNSNPYTQAHPTTHPNITPSTSSSRTRHRDPTRECSKHSFDAVCHGIEEDEIYISWHQAAPNCWNPTTQGFYGNCVCKSFSTYDEAADWLLSTATPSDLPPEPPLEPSNLSHASTTSAIHDNDSIHPKNTGIGSHLNSNGGLREIHFRKMAC